MMKKIACGLAMSVFAATVFAGCGPAGEPAPGAAAQPVLALSGNRISGDLPMQASLKVNATASGCTNSGGPQIKLDGELLVGTVKSKITLKNNTKGTHTTSSGDISTEVDLDVGSDIHFAKQPPLGGVGGNPFIYIEFVDDQGGALSDKMLLGRCVQGLSPAALEFALPAKAQVDVTSDACTNSGGPYINIDGDIVLRGVNARLTFQNNVKGTLRTDPTAVTVDVTLTPETPFSVRKSPHFGGAGGNPLVYIDFLRADESVIDSFSLGRCNQI